MPLSLEYLAGLFDGEGCVSTNGRNYLTATIANSHMGILYEIQAEWGGSISVRPNGSATLTLSTRNARRFLEALLPHLIIKKEVAGVGLTLHTVPHGPERDAIRLRMQDLNRITSPRSGNYLRQVK
jgi:hypothetical protein